MSEGKGPYRVFPTDRLVSGNLLLRSVQPDDIEAIRQWRNAQMDVLRQSREISVQEQIDYFRANVWPEMGSAEPRLVLFAIERSHSIVGYGGLVHISWPDRRAEVSFLLSPDIEKNPNERAAVFGSFLREMKSLAFETLHLNRLFAETFSHRRAHIASLLAAGFRSEGVLRQHVFVNGRASDALIHGVVASDLGGDG